MILKPRKPLTDARRAESALIRAEIRKNADARAAHKAEAVRVRADAVRSLATWISARADADERAMLVGWLGQLRPADMAELMTALDPGTVI
jgi:hypothetical protein